VNRPQTYIVEKGFTGRDGLHRVFVGGQALPLYSDEPLPEGTAVIIIGNKAVRP